MRPVFPIVYPFLCDTCRRAIYEMSGTAYLRINDVIPALCNDECAPFFRKALFKLNSLGREVTIPRRAQIRKLEFLRDRLVGVIKIRAGLTTKENYAEWLRIKWKQEQVVFSDSPVLKNIFLDSPEASKEISVSSNYYPYPSVAPPRGTRIEAIKRPAQIGDVRRWFNLHGQYSWKYLRDE